MNITILCIDIISFLIIFLLSRLVFKSLRNPIFVICAWWLLCLFLSNVVVIGEGVFWGTHLLFLLFIYSILGFGAFYRFTARRANYLMPRFIYRYRAFFIVMAMLIYLLSVYLGIVGFRLQAVYGPEFRSLFFSTGDYSSLIYGNYYLQVIANLVLSPLILFGIIALPVAGIYYSDYRYMLLGFIFAAAVDFQGSGRFSLYCFVLAMALAALLVKKVKLLSHVKITIIACAAIILFGTITRQRLQEGEFNRDIVSTIVEQAISYHLIGIYLFDREFSNDLSALHQESSFGRLTLLSYPDRVICMVIRRFGIRVSPTIDMLGERWQRTVVLGADGNGRSIESNAFYTSLYPIYYDFGYLGVVLVPGILVYFLILHFKAYRTSNNFTSLFVVIFLSVFFMTSIFDAKITAPDFSFVIFCILLLRRAPRTQMLQNGLHRAPFVAKQRGIPAIANE
jgi:oligosaccharide repeat unit polymerase